MRLAVDLRTPTVAGKRVWMVGSTTVHALHTYQSIRLMFPSRLLDTVPRQSRRAGSLGESLIENEGIQKKEGGKMI